DGAGRFGAGESVRGHLDGRSSRSASTRPHYGNRSATARFRRTCLVIPCGRKQERRLVVFLSVRTGSKTAVGRVGSRGAGDDHFRDRQTSAKLVQRGSAALDHSPRVAV